MFNSNEIFFFLDEPTKVSVHTNEGHPGLLETLQINNNKQVLPALTEEAMSNKLPLIDKLIFILISARQNSTNNTNAERYFAVETARGYIIINREYGNIDFIFFFICLYIYLALKIKLKELDYYHF